MVEVTGTDGGGSRGDTVGTLTNDWGQNLNQLALIMMHRRSMVHVASEQVEHNSST